MIDSLHALEIDPVKTEGYTISNVSRSSTPVARQETPMPTITHCPRRLRKPENIYPSSRLCSGIRRPSTDPKSKVQNHQCNLCLSRGL